jgi:hypothetical protein
MHSLTSALDGGEWSDSRPGHFTPGVRDIAPVKSSDEFSNLRKVSNPDCPARSPGLYRLSYHGSDNNIKEEVKL